MGIDLRLAAKTKKVRTEEELKKLNYKLLTVSSLGWGIKPIKPYEVRSSDYTFYQFDTLCRYYGAGYERGDFGEIYNVLRWFRHNFPEAEILYGGDDDYFEEMSPMSVEEQEELMELWCESGGLNYRGDTPKDPLFQRNCPNCDVIMTQYMWSGGSGEINCLGCGHAEKTEDQGQTWSVIRTDRFQKK